jgi:hypothetical protein
VDADESPIAVARVRSGSNREELRSSCYVRFVRHRHFSFVAAHATELSRAASSGRKALFRRLSGTRTIAGLAGSPAA